MSVYTAYIYIYIWIRPRYVDLTAIRGYACWHQRTKGKKHMMMSCPMLQNPFEVILGRYGVSSRRLCMNYTDLNSQSSASPPHLWKRDLNKKLVTSHQNHSSQMSNCHSCQMSECLLWLNLNFSKIPIPSDHTHTQTRNAQDTQNPTLHLCWWTCFSVPRFEAP